jgi:four helix bundle protein
MATTYRRFQELPVWNAAIELAVRVLAMTRTGCLQGHSGLRGRLERAVVSISNNIAEGFSRGTHDELISFLYIARGSTNEVLSMLHLIARLPMASGVVESIPGLMAHCDDVALQLNHWLASLKDSHRRGPRFDNTAAREAAERARRAQVAAQELRRIVEEHRERSGGTEP